METTPIHRGPSRHRSSRCFSPAAIQRSQLMPGSLSSAWLAAVDDILTWTTRADLLCNEPQMITWVKGLGEFTSRIAWQCSMRPC